MPAAAATTAAAPWSACRLWDPNPTFAPGPEDQQSPDTDQEQQQQQQQTDRGSRFRQVQHGAEPSRDGSDAAAARDDTEMLEADDEEDGEADPACTTSGCLGLSCGGHHFQAPLIAVYIACAFYDGHMRMLCKL